MPKHKTVPTPPPTLIKVDKGVPIPLARNTINWKILPFGTIEIGDSFFVPLELFNSATNRANGKTVDVQSVQTRIASKIVMYRPKKYVTRSEKTGVRIWRVE